MRLASVALVLAALFSLSIARPTRADVPPDVTFQGSAGGGTIELTFSQNLGTLKRVSLKNVTYPEDNGNGCTATVTVVYHYDPPITPGAGTFTASLVPAGSGLLLIDKASVSASFNGPGKVQGSTSLSATTGEPEVGCVSDSLPFSASGPADTPPAPDDLFYRGPVDGYSGAVELHRSRDGGITSIGLDGATGPCINVGNPLDARNFFSPEVAQAPGTGAFTASVAFSGSDPSLIRSVTVDAAQPDAGHITGTLTFAQPLPSFCTEHTTFTAQLQTPVGGVGELAGVARPSPAFPWLATATEAALLAIAWCALRLRAR
jgi:hypothetical protein